MPLHPICFRSVLLLAVWAASPARSEVVINELMAGGSERLLRWSADGVPTLGTGAAWYSGTFTDAAWQTGTGPFGFGSFTNVSPLPVITTNTATQMQNLTPTLYLRKTFTVSAGEAARTSPLQLEVQYNDGFICYLNGVEAVRRNAGPGKQFAYRDQFAAFGTPANNEAHTTPYLRTEIVPLGAANTKLLAGINVLAIHALNHWEATSVFNSGTNVFASVNNRDNFFFKGDLKITESPAVTLVTNNTPWRYQSGVVEPSGGVYDPARLFVGRQNVRWGRPSFDDAGWSSGAAPFAAGPPPPGVTPGTNVTAAVIGITPSIYQRTVFTVTATDLADPQALQLLMDYDDGFVAYLNGVEVARAGMSEANSFTPHNAVASGARTPGTYAAYNLDPPARLLTSGQNVLAVQVHNVSSANSDLYFRTELKTTAAGTGRTLVPSTAVFRYFVGVQEPVESGDEAIEDNPEAPDSAVDWVELHNTGGEAVSLGNWRFSDDPNEPAKWIFPPEATLPAGGYLLLACDDQNITAPPANGYYHTGFKLDAAGETLVLSDSLGTLRQQLAFRAQTAFQSYGRTGTGTYAYHDTPTPAAANGGAVLSGQVAAPVASVAGGFYPTARTVTLSSATPGASIRYTLDGTDPSATTGTAGTSVNVSLSRALRARAFAAGMIPSEAITRTYLINEPASRQGLPALCITGDEQRSLYQPFGVMAIKGGATTNFAAPLPTGNNGIWSQAGPGAAATADLTAYNNPIHRGRFMERPANMEILHANGTSGPNIGFGLRISGSSHARPRYLLANQNRMPGASPAPNEGSWSSTSTQKPSFNFFFRNDYGGDPLEHELFPGYAVTQFHDVRVRAGKNDPSNPFVEDEFMRRLFISTGQVGSMGMINTLYVNGVYKGYYNLCEHVREDFLQRHYQSTLAWDVRQVTTIASGDGLAFQEMITYLRNNPQATLPNYQRMKTRLDMVNFIDYLCVNLMGNTGDWPHNNFICARERSVNGLHRYYLWDAEGAFGDFGGNHVRTNMFVSTSTASITTAAPATAGLGDGIRILYTLLRDSPEFKLLFADRLQKHFYNGGALTEAAMAALWNPLKAQLAPVIAPTAVTDRVTPWVNGVGNPARFTAAGATNNPSRRNVLFNGYTDDDAGGIMVAAHLVAEGLWPATKAPAFSQTPGPVTSGSGLTLTNPNASGTIHYTLTGLDPRAESGATTGTPYSSAITLTYPTTVMARVRSTSGEWSPLMQGHFLTTMIEPLILSELMYHPPDFGTVNGDEYEFLELKNTGTRTLQLGGMRFTAGINYSFPAGSTLAAGDRLVLARSTARFLEVHPGITPFGEWGAASNLSNSGESLTLVNTAELTVFSVTWTDAPPWPPEADGLGRSLVPVDPALTPSPASPAAWRVSSQPGGSAGADDPAPPAPTIHINEILANFVPPETNRIELYNPNPLAVDVSHWWLSDSNVILQKYRIPAGTIIPAGGYSVFTEAEFNTGANAFAFSPTGGTAVLSSGNAAGDLTGYSTAVAFGASESGVSSGRYLNTGGAAFHTPLSRPTFGAANAGPRTGPLVISELLYWPVAGNEEFLELRNIGGVSLPLFDPANPSHLWKVDGINFSFPAGVTLAPGQIVLVVPLAPDAFRTKYSIPPATVIFGPATGSLRNEGEKITLQKPGTPYLDAGGVTVVPFIDIDQVTYGPLAPWPTTAGGPNGISLERLNAHAFGNDSTNWRAAAVGGTVGRLAPLTWSQWSAVHFTPSQRSDPSIGTALADSDSDGLSNAEEWAHGTYPQQPDAAPTTGSIVPVGMVRYFQLTTRRSRSASSLLLQADTSAGLSAWASGAAMITGTPVDLGDGTESVTFRYPATTSNAARQFMRLRISGN